MGYVASAIIGGLVSVSGIVVGNVAISKTMDGYDESIAEKRDMFSQGEVVYANNKRTLSAKWYRSTHLNGPLTRMLRIGQGLTIAGFFVALALLAI